MNKSVKDKDVKTVEVVEVVEKPLVIMHVKQSSLYRVARKGGGHVPKQLSGMWTDSALANQAIESYNTNKAKELAA